MLFIKQENEENSILLFHRVMNLYLTEAFLSTFLQVEEGAFFNMINIPNDDIRQ